MTPEQQAAFVMAAASRAIVRAIACHAENMQRQSQGYSMAYDADAIERIIDEEGVGYNAVMTVFRG